MNSPNSLLHLGLGKCGSSALQRALSSQPNFTSRDGKHYAYVAISPSGELRDSNLLAAAAARSVHGYVASANAELIASLGVRRISVIGRALRAMVDAGQVPILSNEGWTRQIELFRQHQLLDRLGLNPEVVVYVRPQVSWLNSAWWQWGAWSGLEFESWLERVVRRTDWWKLIEPWNALVGASNVKIRPLPDDVVIDFFSLLNSVPPSVARSNQSLPGSVLRIMQRHRELRPGAHASAVEFALEGHFVPSATDETPWVIGPSWAKRIIEECRTGNERLLEALDDAGRQKMRSDPRWWDASAYGERPSEPADRVPPEAVQTDEVAAKALAVIEELDRENRRLQEENRRLKNDAGRLRSRANWKSTWRRWLHRVGRSDS